MAELIVTDEEKAAAKYLDWDDAAIGKICKKIALIIGEPDERHTLAITAAAHILICKCIESNSVHTVLKIEGLTSGGKSLGDWEIALKCLSSEETNEDQT